MIPFNLYIHIPFCRSKCHYCHFFSKTNQQNLIPSYFNSLKNEINLWKEKLTNFQIETIYFGGGTPSLVSPHLISDLLKTINTNFKVIKKAEITIEINPETISLDKLKIYKQSNINRLSFGLQSCDNQTLNDLGRKSKFEDFKKAFFYAKKLNFKNLNIDLIFGIPNQTLNNWKNTLKTVLNFQPTHLSCYSLELDNYSYFGNLLKQKKLKPIDEVLDRKMYHFAKNYIKQNSFIHYEVSNFAKVGYRCRHNLNFWNGAEYLGIGAGAHSFIQNQTFYNPENINRYISKFSNPNLVSFNIAHFYSNLQKLTKKALVNRKLLLNLRLVKGINISNFNLRNKIDLFKIYNLQFSNLRKRGLIKITKTKIYPTKIGLDLQNQIMEEFV